MKKIVIALGGNALQEAGKPATAEAQLEVVEKTAEYIADIIEAGYKVVVAHGNGDAKVTQMTDSGALRHVRTLHKKALAPQNFRKGTHGNTADAHKMDPLSGEEVFRNGVRIIHHEESSFPEMKKHISLFAK